MPDTAPLTADFHRVEVHPPATPFTGLGTLTVGVITIAALYSGGACRCRRSGMGADVLGHWLVSCRRADHRLCDRALALRPQHGAFRRGGASRRRFLDIALGAGRTAPVDAADHVPGCAGAACRAFAVPRGAARRPACPGAGGGLLSTHAGGRP